LTTYCFTAYNDFGHHFIDENILLFQDHHIAPKGNDCQHVGEAQGVPLAVSEGICRLRKI